MAAVPGRALLRSSQCILMHFDQTTGDPKFCFSKIAVANRSAIDCQRTPMPSIDQWQENRAPVRDIWPLANGGKTEDRI